MSAFIDLWLLFSDMSCPYKMLGTLQNFLMDSKGVIASLEMKWNCYCSNLMSLNTTMHPPYRESSKENKGGRLCGLTPWRKQTACSKARQLGNQILVGKGLVSETETKAEEIICIFPSRNRGRCFGIFFFFLEKEQ